MKNLNELSRQICKVAMVGIKEYDEFFRVWHKIMSKYPFEVVLKTWDNILEDTELSKWDYFVTNRWVTKADYVYYRQKQTETPLQSTERPIRSNDTADEKKWQHNLNLWTTGQQCRWQYILNAVKIRQFTQDDLGIELNRKGKMCDKAVNTLTITI